MHFNDFLQLNETAQVELLWYNGEQIGRRKEDDYLVLLYQVEGFYVEVFYHRKERMIKKYLSFDCSDRRLDTYLEKIDLSPVYKVMRKPAKFTENGLVNYFLSMAMDKSSEKSETLTDNRKGRERTGFWDVFSRFLQRFSK